MTDDQCRFFQGWFKNHARTFRESDPLHQRSLDLKEEHTARVCAAADRITSGLGLSDNARRLATTTALFHDLGRFPQYRQHRTFRDPDSENHAKLSLRELHRHRVLHILDPAERHLISRAIIFHNRQCLPDHLEEETLLHCRLIRDADKVDILRVMAEHFQRPEPLRNPVITLGLPQDGGVRDTVYRQLFEGRIMNYAELKTTNELKILQLSWVFDVNFRPTFEILKERNDIGALAATIPDSLLLRQAVSFVNEYIDRQLVSRGEQGSLSKGTAPSPSSLPHALKEAC